MKVEFSGQISKNTPVSNFMKIRRVEADFFHADGHGEANTCFSRRA